MKASCAGVTTSVRMVAKPRPKTIAVESWIHHCVDGAPMVISRCTKLTLSAEGDRQHAEHRRAGGQQHRPRTLAAGAQDRLLDRHALAPQSVIGVDQHDVVVGDDAGERDDADAGHHDAERPGP